MFNLMRENNSSGFMMKPMNPGTPSNEDGVTLSWKDLSIYATDKNKNIYKQLINNGMFNLNNFLIFIFFLNLFFFFIYS